MVSSSSNTYAYREYIETLLTFGKAYKKTFHTNSMWYKDGAGHMNDLGMKTFGAKRHSLHAVEPSQFANCVEPSRPQQWGPDLPFLGKAGHAGPLDGLRCSSQVRVMSRLIQVRHHQTKESGFVISAINKYMLGNRYP